MSQIAIIAGSIVVPSGAFIANLYLRYSRGASQSAGADLILLLITFDASVILAHKDFERLVPSPELSAAIIPIFMCFAIAASLAWFFSIFSAEKRIVESFDSAKGGYSNTFPFGWWLVSWLIALTLSAFHVITFILK